MCQYLTIIIPETNDTDVAISIFLWFIISSVFCIELFDWFAGVMTSYRLFSCMATSITEAIIKLTTATAPKQNKLVVR